MGNKPFLLSLYDYTGNWSQPYRDAGWRVLMWDQQYEGDILKNFSRLHMLIDQENNGRINGLLADPPCTAFAGSGVRWWAEKDGPDLNYFPFLSFTEYMISLSLIVLHMVDLFKPDLWALENPVGRIKKLVPELKKYRLMTFQPCDYGDPYTKRTVLYGQFNPDLPTKKVIPADGSKMRNIPPGPNRKNVRSATPPGFSNAFFLANSQRLNTQLNLLEV